MDPVLKKILAAHEGTSDGKIAERPVSPSVSSVPGGKTIALSLRTLHLVKPGMYWYSNNTVSETLDTSKQLKSVVLVVKEGTVYGDSFEQRYVLGKKIPAYIHETSMKLGHPLYRPKISELTELYEVRELVNRALNRIKKLPWSEELYWAELAENQNSQLIDLFDSSSMKMSNEMGAYCRPMITLQVR